MTTLTALNISCKFAAVVLVAGAVVVGAGGQVPLRIVVTNEKELRDRSALYSSCNSPLRQNIFQNKFSILFMSLTQF